MERGDDFGDFVCVDIAMGLGIAPGVTSDTGGVDTSSPGREMDAPRPPPIATFDTIGVAVSSSAALSMASVGEVDLSPMGGAEITGSTTRGSVAGTGVSSSVLISASDPIAEFRRISLLFRLADSLSTLSVKEYPADISAFHHLLSSLSSSVGSFPLTLAI